MESHWKVELSNVTVTVAARRVRSLLVLITILLFYDKTLDD